MVNTRNSGTGNTPRKEKSRRHSKSRREDKSERRSTRSKNKLPDDKTADFRSSVDEEDVLDYIKRQDVRSRRFLRMESSENEERNLPIGRKKMREIKDLLVMQGKDVNGFDKLPSSPDIYQSVKSRSEYSRTNDNIAISPRKRNPRYYVDDEASEVNGLIEDNGDDENANDEEEQSDNEEEKSDNEEEKSDNEEEKSDEEEEEDESYDEDESEEESVKKYSLRERKPPERFSSEFNSEPSRRSTRNKINYSEKFRSPYKKPKKRAVSQASDSDSPSSSDDDDRARGKINPFAFKAQRAKKSSMAPIEIDKSITFDSIGGHEHIINCLNEMVVFPLVYPEIFEKFNISPPRGCIFYGPPGTGKTLMARALANESSKQNQKVSFFMRRGTDCLNKWVGESEKRLRELFTEAYDKRPSIIFFDELDGLAPVRAGHDHIFTSIVSTLLALMDGLNSRGEVVVIGATNRIDSIDPALRRPGRFDREFLFPLPNKKARRQILAIHTKKWEPKLKDSYLDQLAERTTGYCGADLKALCTEAPLQTLQRTYPQLYKTRKKLSIDMSKLVVESCDFSRAIKKIKPASRRLTQVRQRPLSIVIKPLLSESLEKAACMIAKLFPQLAGKSHVIQEMEEPPDFLPKSIYDYNTASDSGSEEDVSSMMRESINESSTHPERNNGVSYGRYGPLLQKIPKVGHRIQETASFCPRLLICGSNKSGQGTHLAPALLHDLEGINICPIGLDIITDTSIDHEKICLNAFHEAMRQTPSVIFLPDAVSWWRVIPESTSIMFNSLLANMRPYSQILFLAVSDCSYHDLPSDLQQLFDDSHGEVFTMPHTFSRQQRQEFFAPVFFINALKQPFRKREIADKLSETLPIATRTRPKPLSAEELAKVEKEEEDVLCDLRMFLRKIINKLMNDRRFREFVRPVDAEDVPDYYRVIKHPMSLETILSNIDRHEYTNVESCKQHIDLICRNTLEYNPDVKAQDRVLRHRACELNDRARSIINSELNPEFEEKCNAILEERKKRGATSGKFVPSYYNVVKQMRPSTRQYRPARQRLSMRRKMSSRRSSSWSRGIIQRNKRTKKNILNETTEDEDKSDKEEETERSDDEEEASSNETPKANISTAEKHKNDKTEEQNIKTNETTSESDTNKKSKFELLSPGHNLTVDSQRLVRLFRRTVKATVAYSLQDLERFHACLNRSVFLHQCNNDKTKLLDDFEKDITTIETPISSS